MFRPTRFVLLCLTSLALACQGEEAESPLPQSTANDDVEGEAYTDYTPGKTDGLTPVDGPLQFEAACQDAEADRLVISAVGDVLLHGALQKQAFREEDRFISLWRGVKPLMEAADIAYANLEGPTARGVNKQGRDATDPGLSFDDHVYSSYPMFNYHPTLVDDLLASGVDVVSTANNHSLDRWALGVDRTIEALEEKGLPYTGTRPRDRSIDWFTVVESKGFKVAFLACTYATNGIPDREDQVLYCYEDREEVVGLVADLAAREEIDAVIVNPHWGKEYDANPSSKQVNLAHELLDAGATAIIGSHPHVLQPWERYVTADGREAFVIYSLGNFVSGQRQLARRSTLLLYLGLVRTDKGVEVEGARYVPLHMTRDADYRYELEVIDAAGGNADSRALTISMFDAYNLDAPGWPVNATPQCDPEWAPAPAPHPLDGWIGGGCEAVEACGTATLCLQREAFTGGLCSEPCDRYCPDAAGRASTFCVDMGFEGQGLCLAQCEVDSDCRDGWACEARERFNEAEVTKTVCVPIPTDAPADEPVE